MTCTGLSRVVQGRVRVRFHISSFPNDAVITDRAWRPPNYRPYTRNLKEERTSHSSPERNVTNHIPVVTLMRSAGRGVDVVDSVSQWGVIRNTRSLAARETKCRVMSCLGSWKPLPLLLMQVLLTSCTSELLKMLPTSVIIKDENKLSLPVQYCQIRSDFFIWDDFIKKNYIPGNVLMKSIK